MFSLISISKKEQITIEFFKNIRKVFELNFKNLYFIITQKENKDLIKIVKRRLNFLEKYEKKTEDFFEKQNYFEEKKHCNMLIFILEENKKINKFIFIENMFEIIDNISNKLKQGKLKIK